METHMTIIDNDTTIEITNGTITRNGIELVEKQPATEAAPERALGECFLPELGANYYSVNERGQIIMSTWDDVGGIDAARRAYGNCFPYTAAGKQQAEAFAKRTALHERALRIRNEIWEREGKPVLGIATYYPLLDWMGNLCCYQSNRRYGPWRFTTASSYKDFIAQFTNTDLRALLVGE